MSARHKLNSAHLLGSFMAASLLGWLTQSIAVFAIALFALVLASCLAGEIRF
jgi:hypothetical protein